MTRTGSARRLRRAPAKRVPGLARAGDAGDTRARLLRAAAHVIDEGGWSSASVGAIAERAGVAAGTLYRHFASKSELFLEVFRSASQRELHAMRDAQAGAMRVSARFDAVLTTYASRALASPRLAWALVYEPLDAAVDAERLAYRHEYCRAMAALIREGVECGELLPLDADLAAAAVVGLMAETLVGPLSPAARGAAPSDARVRAIVALCRRVVGFPAPS